MKVSPKAPKSGRIIWTSRPTSLSPTVASCLCHLINVSCILLVQSKVKASVSRNGIIEVVIKGLFKI